MALILIIDDNEALRSVIRRALEAEGHEIVEAIDGYDGTRRLASIAPQVLVTDILMPTKEGLETIREVRATRPEISIIAISGGGTGAMNTSDLLNIAQEFGADVVLPKPFRLEALRQAVDGLLKRT